MRQMTMEELALPIKGAMRDGPFGSNLKSSDFVDEGIKVIRTQNIKKTGYVDQNVAFITPEKAEELARYEFKPGDLVIAKLGVDPGVAAVIPESCGSGIIPADVVRFRGDPAIIDHDYLARFLNSPKAKRQIEQRSRGSTRIRVNLTALREILIDVPSLDEQRRIAAIFDKADEINRSANQVNASKSKIIQSYFLEMFGDPSVRDKWPLHPIEEIAEDVQYGTAKKANSEGLGPPVLRMNNLTEEGFIVLDSLKHCELEEEDLSKFTVRKYDILFNRTNSPKLVGKTSIWLSDENYSFAGYLIRVRLDTEVIDPYYLWAYMNSKYCKAFLFQKAKASNNMSNFSGGELKKMVIPLPPKSLQMKFRQVAETTMENWELVSVTGETSSNLVESLVQTMI